ncbi:hypothetical protein C8R42DRAFT_724064 [Lentinula raphanica]|nr:hypothetical protein C8R42DRAFT_724064 [Lentinula raphanica]
MLKSLIPKLKHHGFRAQNLFYPTSTLLIGSTFSLRGYRKTNDADTVEKTTFESSPAVQNLLRKFEAFGNKSPDEACMHSQETIDKHVSVDIRKYTRANERDITLKDLRIARRLDFQTYVQTKLHELDPSTPSGLRKRMRLKYITQAVARWHSLTLDEKLDIAQSVRQRRLDPCDPIGPPRESIIRQRERKRLQAQRKIRRRIRQLRMNKAWAKRKRRRYIKRREQRHPLLS